MLLAVWVLVTAAPVDAYMLYGYEDAFGVLHLSDRKLGDQYLPLYSYDEKAKQVGFDEIRKIIRGKTAEKKAADQKSSKSFWISNPSTPRLAKTQDGFLTGTGFSGKMWPPPPGANSGERRRLATPSSELLETIRRHCQRHGLDPNLVYAVIEAESNFQPNAVSPKGAQGLMQIMPDTGRELGLSSPFDPERNIEAGVRYLRSMFDKFGSPQLALAAYNAGPACVEQHGGVPPIPETMQYVSKIMSRYGSLKGSAIRPIPGLKMVETAGDQ